MLPRYSRRLPQDEFSESASRARAFAGILSPVPEILNWISQKSKIGYVASGTIEFEDTNFTYEYFSSRAPLSQYVISPDTVLSSLVLACPTFDAAVLPLQNGITLKIVREGIPFKFSEAPVGDSTYRTDGVDVRIRGCIEDDQVCSVYCVWAAEANGEIRIYSPLKNILRRIATECGMYGMCLRRDGKVIYHFANSSEDTYMQLSADQDSPVVSNDELLFYTTEIFSGSLELTTVVPVHLGFVPGLANVALYFQCSVFLPDSF
ncbi:MAG: hypothetical protein U5N86_04270 [Planctomycetota bacterium]|nr:hypothetical protein [Planctomycetota bacterium]